MTDYEKEIWDGEVRHRRLKLAPPTTFGCTIVAADALIRSQAEQIATLDTECLRLGIEEAKLQAKVEALTSERDALEKSLIIKRKSAYYLPMLLIEHWIYLQDGSTATKVFTCYASMRSLAK